GPRIGFVEGVHSMNRHYRRFLVASVSLGALSALPAGAATTSTVNCDPGVQNGCDLSISDPTGVDLTLVISGAGDDYFYGESGAATASVTGTANGEIHQRGTATAGDAGLVIENLGSAMIGAVATTSGAAPSAAAYIDLA